MEGTAYREDAATAGLRWTDGLMGGEPPGFGDFFEHVPELFGITTYDGLILKANAAWQRILGYTAEELSLTSLSDHVHPEDQGACRNALRALHSAGAVSVTLRMSDKNGTACWIAWKVVTAVGRLFASGRDVTRWQQPVGTSTAARRQPRVASPPGVLLAEGNRSILHVLSLRLAAAGLAVIPALHGQAAIELALAAQDSGRPFNLILVDIQLPILDGFEVTRTLRDAGYSYPIVAISAHVTSEDRADCLRLGCDGHLVKPIEYPDVARLIAARTAHGLLAT
jgi:PAS domain S-box-containing protein